MKHFDLFSGIGGFALAVDRVWPGSEHVFCEIDPFCQEVLKKHWPNSKIHGDIRTFTNSTKQRLERLGQERQNQVEFNRESEIFLLTGGFPCQPFSQAGRRQGTSDDRYLWPEMLRVIREFSPQWVIGENVGGFVTWSDGLVLRQVFTDLESEGYEVQAFIIPAVSVNAPHRRDRIWIIGHSKHNGFNGAEDRESNNSGSDSYTERTDEFRQPQRADSVWKDVTHTKRTGHEGEEYKTGQSTGHSGRSQQQNWDKDWLEVATRLCRVDDGLPRRMDRNPRLKALGNAIVPQVAEEIMRAISKLPSHTLTNNHNGTERIWTTD